MTALEWVSIVIRAIYGDKGVGVTSSDGNKLRALAVMLDRIDDATEHLMGSKPVGRVIQADLLRMASRLDEPEIPVDSVSRTG